MYRIFLSKVWYTELVNYTNKGNNEEDCKKRQLLYRSCMGLLKLAEKYSPEKLEQVCAKALSYSGKPSYKSIKNLLVAAKDEPDTGSESSQAVKPHGITRGARYYGGKQS